MGEKDENYSLKKIALAKELIDEALKEIVVLEVRIKSREEGMKTLPENGEKAVQMERGQAEIDSFKEKVFGLEQTIKMLGIKIEEYKKPLSRK